MKKESDESLDKLTRQLAARLGPGGSELFSACIEVMEKQGWTRATLGGHLMRITDFLSEMEEEWPSPPPR